MSRDRDFQQCGMCDQKRLRSACAYAQSDQCLCWSLEYSMNIKLLTEHQLEFLSLKGGYTGLSEYIHSKMPYCWKSHVMSQMLIFCLIRVLICFPTPGRRQSKTLSTIDERGSNIDRNSVFDCHLSQVGRQMAIENTVSIDFLSTFLDSIGVFDCRLPGVFPKYLPKVPLSVSFVNLFLLFLF